MRHQKEVTLIMEDGITEYMGDVRLLLGTQVDMVDHLHQAQLILEPVVHQTIIETQEDLHPTGKIIKKMFNHSTNIDLFLGLIFELKFSK